MRKCLMFSLIFFAKIALSQVNDNFDDGNFTNNPPWTGSNSSNDFTVANNQLRSNSTTASSNFYLSTASSLASNCVWEFYCNLQFATSGSNYVDVYLTSDQANLQAASINGYFVRIGNTSDEICLYKRSGASSTSIKLIDGVDASVSSTSNNRIKIKVTRTSSNLFSLERDITGLGTSYLSEGSVTDASFSTSNYFGIYVVQSTSGFHQKHFFDDISISPLVVDNTPPKLLSAAVLNETDIELAFDEPLDETSAKTTANYSLNNGYGNPASITSGTDAKHFILRYANSLKTGSYTLTATNILDKNNNAITGNNTASFSYIQPYVARKGDIVINEIFADPSPQVDLPGLEFVELWNTSVETISLQNWKYSDASSTSTLANYSIAPDEHLIICAKADTAEFKTFGKVLGISPWPSLNNSGDNLKLLSPLGLTIDSVDYKDTWYKNPEKKAGGWSLELIDNKSVCGGIQNWVGSIDASGGTPGRRNSAYKANTTTGPLSVSSASLRDSATVTLTFNRMVDSLSASNPSNYVVNNGLGSPVLVKVIAPDFKQAELTFSNAISRGKIYKATASNITDCSGILISTGNNSAEFTYPESAAKGDILISEILFNPRPDGLDFVEIYNNSGSDFDLKELSIATTKGADSLVSIKPISPTQLLLKPKQYLVLSIDPDNIKKEYHTENPDAFLKMVSMPSFNDDAGTVVLLSGSARIDQFNYSAKMHFGLIKDAEGVSLERVSFNRPTAENGNFRSAASSVGFATPGYKNSQNLDEPNKVEEVSLSSKSFSPDNDGFEDALTINYNFKEAGLVANASIYNAQGVLVKRLVKNSTLANEGSIYWDGLDENSNKAKVGIYIVYMDVFDLKGNTKKFKKSCVLAVKL